MDELREELNRLNISDLRERAKNIGISTPTIFSKESLIDKIARDTLSYKSDRGRPSIIDEDTIGFRPTPLDIPDEYPQVDLCPIKKLSSNNSGINYADEIVPDIKDRDLGNCKGYIYNDGVSTMLLNNNLSDKEKCYPIPGYVLSDIYKLADFVEGIYIDTPEGKVVNQLFGVELQYQRGIYRAINRIPPTNRFLTVKGFTKIPLGKRNLYLSSSKINSASMIQLIRNSTNQSVLSLSLSLMPEDLYTLTRDDFCTLNGEDEDVKCRAMDLFVNRVKRIVEDGESVIVFLGDLISIYLDCNLSVKLRQKFLNLFNMAGFYENSSTVTIVSFATDEFVSQDVTLREWFHVMDVKVHKMQ